MFALVCDSLVVPTPPSPIVSESAPQNRNSQLVPSSPSQANITPQIPLYRQSKPEVAHRSGQSPHGPVVTALQNVSGSPLDRHGAYSYLPSLAP